MEGLILESGPQQGVIVELGNEIVLLGRSDGCHIHLDDEAVSREHAAVVPQGRRRVLRDLQSRNGTQMDGHFVQERALRPGDVFCIGQTRVRYTDEISAEDRALYVTRDMESPAVPRPAQKIRVVYDRGQPSNYTYAAFACCVLGVNWFFGLVALGLGVAGVVDTKARGAPKGLKMALASCVVALCICLFHGHRLVWQPGMQYLRERRAKYRCRRNMRVIHGAILTYLTDHPAAYPRDLEQLLPKYLRKAEHLICPLAHEPMTLPRGHETSYIYFGGGASTTDAGTVLLVDHNPLNHAGKGRHVLYADGHIEFMPERAAASLVERALGKHAEPDAGQPQ